jgi:hypothetical protein
MLKTFHFPYTVTATFFNPTVTSWKSEQYMGSFQPQTFSVASSVTNVLDLCSWHSFFFFFFFFFFLVISRGKNVYFNSMVCVQQTVRIYFNAGVYKKRLTVQKLILPFLPKTLPDKKILWKFRRLLHSFTAFTPSYKERNILVSSRFHPTFCLRHIPVRLRSADLILQKKSTCKVSLFSASYSTKDLKNLWKLDTFRKNTSFYLSHIQSLSIWMLQILKLRTK